ncbi:calcium:sodium antiporter [Malaciobacter marinus]|uniref:Calcium:sodium antiporter n=1 Tax=Malaciobacter marinus TaxID=505249 RepID=A0A347TLP5_9BACT|nr:MULTISPECIES: calcium/sodium antiporter [Malaciobacter]AXX87523.1 calcium:sodium antiporter [Malaciobacter marinus]PHO12251.1 sodium:proton exchanger [Malaciobacter marinus]PHO16181.1 sodium:proton exchanger [Malaciobacter marinus]RYA24523.1 sodium:calcium antiporter [Malaciobacter halophilus]
MDFLIFTISMAALIYGADFIIQQSEKIALHYNISHFVIGATLVAVGTSLPEMAVSMSAAIKGNADIAVANVIGSTIFNISLVLGAVFLVAKKISPDRDLFAKDSAWSLFPILIFILMAIDGKLNAIDGILFLLLMAGYVIFLIGSNQVEQIDEELAKEKFDWKKSIVLLLIGFVFVVVGADFAIDSASNIARTFGISEWAIGLFLIAFGTSLPELTISIKSALKNNADLAIGNIIGSNVANFTMVLGVSSIVSVLNVDLSKNFFDIAAAFIVSLMLVFITANKLYNKSAGIALLVVLALVIQNSLV